jgi:hypothetical protein
LQPTKVTLPNLIAPTGFSSTFVHWQDGYKNTRAKEKYSRATFNMTNAIYTRIPPAMGGMGM